MNFFQSFHALGYSAINIVLLWLLIVIVVSRFLNLSSRGWLIQTWYIVVMLVPLVLAVNFLADQNKMLNDAIRQDGGIKQNFPKN